jgi:hypothetical protein
MAGRRPGTRTREAAVCAPDEWKEDCCVTEGAEESGAGRAGKPYEMLVEFGKIREFARATGSDHEGYLADPAAVVPPTFLASSWFWRGPESEPPGGVPGDLSRVLHGSQEYIFHGEPPRAGARLTAVSRVAERYQKQGRRGGAMTFTVIVTEFRDGDRLAAEERSTVIETGQVPTEGAS